MLTVAIVDAVEEVDWKEIKRTMANVAPS